MQGHPLSTVEKRHINAHYKRKFPSVIARELSNLYPDDNGGSRSTVCVKRYIARKKKRERE